MLVIPLVAECLRCLLNLVRFPICSSERLVVTAELALGYLQHPLVTHAQTYTRALARARFSFSLDTERVELYCCFLKLHPRPARACAFTSVSPSLPLLVPPSASLPPSLPPSLFRMNHWKAVYFLMAAWSGVCALVARWVGGWVIQ